MFISMLNALFTLLLVGAGWGGLGFTLRFNAEMSLYTIEVITLLLADLGEYPRDQCGHQRNK